MAVNPLLSCRRHPRKNIRWRYPKSFPYRIIYEVLQREKTVVVAPCFMLPGTTEMATTHIKNHKICASPRLTASRIRLRVPSRSRGKTQRCFDVHATGIVRLRSVVPPSGCSFVELHQPTLNLAQSQAQSLHLIAD